MLLRSWFYHYLSVLLLPVWSACDGDIDVCRISPQLDFAWNRLGGGGCFILIAVPKKVTDQSPYYACVTYLTHYATVPNEHWASLIQTRPRRVRLLSTSVNVVRFATDDIYKYTLPLRRHAGMYVHWYVLYVF